MNWPPLPPPHTTTTNLSNHHHHHHLSCGATLWTGCFSLRLRKRAWLRSISSDLVIMTPGLEQVWVLASWLSQDYYHHVKKMSISILLSRFWLGFELHDSTFAWFCRWTLSSHGKWKGYPQLHNIRSHSGRCWDNSRTLEERFKTKELKTLYILFIN